MDDRLAAAISHWAPRFTANGVTAADFERITHDLPSWDEWCSAGVRSPPNTSNSAGMR
jgi:hypothetical protein